MPSDIASCEETSRLYVAGECVWRVSSDGKDIKSLLPKSPSETVRPQRLSVTATRLLVTSRYTRQLMEFSADGDELRLVRLPRYMDPHHAVESPTGTFIVSHLNTQRNQHQVSEVNTEEQVLRQFSSLSLGWSPHIAVDSRGNIFVADRDNSRILLLGRVGAQLALRRVIIDEYQLSNKPPCSLYYEEEARQLLVGLYDIGVTTFDVL